VRSLDDYTKLTGHVCMQAVQATCQLTSHHHHMEKMEAGLKDRITYY